MFLSFVSLALAADARLEWRAGAGRLAVDAPGEHVNPDAPAWVHVGALQLELRGDPTAVRFPVGPGPIAVEVELGLCADTSAACRLVHFRGGGDVHGRKGTLALAEVGPEDAGPGQSGAPNASGVVKVIDFGAVWCPPCNLLLAEVLHDPAATAGVPIEPVDVDRPESWTLKDRYHVGGYPTLVAVDAAGGEVARMVGYPGPTAARAWFAELRGVVPLETLAKDAVDGKLMGQLTGDAAAAAARRLAEGERADAARVLFARASDTADLHVARLLVDPTEPDARWLFAHHVPAGDWVYAALDVAPTAWMDAAALATGVPPAQGADLFAAAAEHAPAESAAVLRIAALALLRGTLTGDPAHDRGNYTFLAELQAETGDLDGAVALLDQAARTFPGEFTFPYAAARQLLDATRFADAEPRARTALARAWGDQELRAAVVLAKVLDGEARRPEAIAVLDAALKETPRPDEAVKVRTHRYVKEAESLRAQLVAPSATKPTGAPAAR